jgi:hypothetical protein
MPYTQEAAMTQAALFKTALATSKLALFLSSFAPTVNSKVADFVAADATYDGYTAGGTAITAFLGPGTDPAGGADVVSPNVFFLYVDGMTHVMNLIGGWYLLTTGGALFAYGVFPAPVAMAANGDFISQVVTLNVGQNPVG